MTNDETAKSNNESVNRNNPWNEPPTRRNILTILGLTGAATPALAIEKFDSTQGWHGEIHTPLPARVPGYIARSAETQSRIAATLDEMAAAVRRGELTAIGVEITSKAPVGEWMVHEIKFLCELSPPGGPVP